MSAIIANAQLTSNEDKLTLSLERLSSGYKINHSKDDPAGLAISQKMHSQIKGLEQADNNAQDGVSVLQTAEGAMTEIQSMLTRMKELTVQAANDVNSVDERAAIQEEIDSLNTEIDRIVNDTDFNTKSLINGNLERRVYSNIDNVKQMEVSDGFTDGTYGITITQDAKKALVKGSGIGMTDTETITEDCVGTVTINGLAVNIEQGDTLGTIATKLANGTYMAGGTMINTADGVSPNKAEYGDTEGYESVPASSGTDFVFMTNKYGSNEYMKVECDNPALAAKLGLPVSQTETGKDVQADFTTSNGERVGFANSATMSTYGNTITVRDNNDKTFIVKVPGNAVAENGGAVDMEQEVTGIGTLRVHVGANENQIIDVNLPEVSVETLGLDNINVYTFTNASKAIEAVDNAVTKLSTLRSKIGAYSNRLDHTVSNLAVSDENLTAAYSRIMDVDMAEEMTEYTSANVLSQAATSILSQANARPETALQLLQS
jgi:flagellin